MTRDAESRALTPPHDSEHHPDCPCHPYNDMREDCTPADCECAQLETLDAMVAAEARRDARENR